MAELNLGDLVWAKMKGFPAWPGRIIEPTDALKKLQKIEKSKCVYFFGTYNHGWIEDENIHSYIEHKDKLLKQGKSKANFSKAIKEIEKYMIDPTESGIITTPARQTTQPKIRESMASDNEANDSSVVESPDEKTPKVANNKVPVTKRAAQKKKPTSPKQSEDETPAKRRRSTVVASPVSKPESPAKRRRSSAAVATPVPKPTPNHNNNNDIAKNDYPSPVPRAARAARAVIDRPDIYVRPESDELDVSTITETLKSKNIKASSSKFGFIGLGIMGSGIVKNLINSGHSVCVYNRTQDKTEKFKAVGADVMLTPSDVIEVADITFSCVSDPAALQNTIFGPYGVTSLSPGLARGKGYVEMTTIDTTTSKDIEAALKINGMSYLEAQIQGTKAQAEEGKLILLAAGDKQLFDNCQTCFEAMGRNSFFVGETGNATKMNLVLQTIAGVQIAGLADSIALAERAGIATGEFMEILEKTNMRSDLVMEKAYAMVDSRFSNVNLPLMHIQKDLRLAINMADALNLPMPLTAIANEGYKNARRLGLAESDASAILYRARH